MTGEVNEQDLDELANLIILEFKKEFASVRLSGNLIDTIQVEKTKNGEINIVIPAQAYDVVEFKRSKQIIPKGNRSYASIVDETGGFSGLHKNFIQRCIDSALTYWTNVKQQDFTSIERMDV